ncbi:HAD family hydrolase [Rubripirellula reticaptiva]|uniref:hypothetical protein n=1 Tax=Rubripirellula reticaptiva TaxID=2528013 RepID=UPI0011B633E2
MRPFLNLLQSSYRFAFAEICLPSKWQHFSAFRHTNGLDYEAMIFFDETKRNITEVIRLKVANVFIENGISLALKQSGLSAGRSEVHWCHLSQETFFCNRSPLYSNTDSTSAILSAPPPRSHLPTDPPCAIAF